MTGTEAVLFDMDGLLIDSEPLWLEAETAVMARLGADWTTADQAQLLGGSLVRTVRYLLGKATRPASPGQVAEWLMTRVTELIRDRGVPLRPRARAGADGGALAGRAESGPRRRIVAYLAQGRGARGFGNTRRQRNRPRPRRPGGRPGGKRAAGWLRRIGYLPRGRPGRLSPGQP